MAVTPTLDIIGNAATQLPGGQQILLNRPGGFTSSNSGDGSSGISANAAASDHSHYGMYDITSPKYGADKTGRTDSTGAIQKAIDEALVTGRAVFAPAGTYLVNYGLNAVMTIDNLKTYYPGFKLIGEGSLATTFLTNVASNAWLTIDNTCANGDYRINQGARLQGFTLKGYGETLATASVGIYFRRQYMITIEDVNIASLTSDGIQVFCGDTISGDNDACQWITMRNVKVERCGSTGGWGINFQYPSTGSYNMSAYWTVENLWVTLCGKNMGANGDGSGAGSCLFDPAGAAMIPPTSGGIRYKGQGIEGDNLVLSENWNCGLFAYQGNGQSFYATLHNIDCENNTYGIWLQGYGEFNVDVYRCHHSSTYVARGAIVIDGRNGISDIGHIKCVDLLADNGLGPNYAAFQFCAGTANAIGFDIEFIRWATTPGVNQKAFDASMFNASNKGQFTEDRRDATWPAQNSYVTYNNKYNTPHLMSNCWTQQATNAAATFDFRTDAHRYGTVLMEAKDIVTVGTQNFNVITPPYFTHGMRLRIQIYNNRGAGRTVTAAWDVVFRDLVGYIDPAPGHMVTSDWEYNRDINGGRMFRVSPFIDVAV